MGMGSAAGARQAVGGMPTIIVRLPRLRGAVLHYHVAMTTSSLASADAVPLRQDAAIIGMVGLAHASSHFAHLLLPVMFPVFLREFGLSYSELGLLMSVFFVVSGVGQAGSGFLVDRLGARPVLFGSLVLFMGACVLASSATGYGALGFGPCAAIGAALADRDARVLCLTGDGGLMFHPGELRTALDEGLNVTFVVFNNNGYGEIADAMREAGVEVIGCTPSAPDMGALAEAMGLPFMRGTDADLPALAGGLKGPCVIEILRPSVRP